MLVYYTGELTGANHQVLDIIAAAIEFTHCYSLIHDDLPAMDDDDFRRGKPSCHKAFDEATAILAGDGLQALAFELLLNRLPAFISPSQTVAVALILAKASGISGMVSGQSLDLNELNQNAISEERLQEIHLLKTGRLISACFTMVLAASPACHPDLAQALTGYAHHMGLVFQIQDDYLDQYAPVELLGKNRSSDTANQKTTYATLYNKTQLEKQIHFHFQSALALLQPFGKLAQGLIDLTKPIPVGVKTPLVGELPRSE
jgi:farnesyl diphosphate synthase